MTTSCHTETRNELLQQCLTNITTNIPKDNINDIIDNFNKLKLYQVQEDLLTDDESEVESILTDDEDTNYYPLVDKTTDLMLLDLSTIYKSDYEKLSLAELRNIAKHFDLNITDAQASQIERITRDQVNSLVWHKLRKGRITASLFKTACSTKADNPSISLLKKICYPEQTFFTSKYTEWGKQHEKHALKEFITEQQATHQIFTNTDSGLIIHPDYPYFGASPDGLCCCNCCGGGCIEIKCPYTIKDGESFDILTTKVNPFLIESEGKYDINKKHLYYFQIQMQLFLTKRSYCYFVVWSPKKLLSIKVFPNEDFWLEQSKKAEVFFKLVVLPELLGKYFTKTNTKAL